MALILSVPTDYGINATYHHIGAVTTNWRDGAVMCVLFSYVDDAARAAGKQPLGSVSLTFEGADFDFTHNEATRAALYAKIKTLAAWAGAADA